jgi:hypothetical protein
MTSSVRIPAGLAGPDVDALRRCLMEEVHRPEVERIELDLSATTAVRRLAPLVAEATAAARALGKELDVLVPSHPASRSEYQRRSAQALYRHRSDDAWSL